MRKPDGLSISTLNTGSLFATATGNEAIKFDLQKFIWVGQAFDDAQVLYLKTSTPYTSFDAIRKVNRAGKHPKMGAQALDHTSNVVVKIAEQILVSTSKSSRDIRACRRYCSISSAAQSTAAPRESVL